LFSANLGKVQAHLLLAIFLVPFGSAQEMSSVPARITIPDGTPVKLQLAESISSAHAHVGDDVSLTVVKDVSLEGLTVIPAGTIARGSITGIRGRRLLGIGGKVSLKVDALQLANGDQVELRGSKEVKGASRTRLMIGAMIVTGLIFLPAAPVFLLTPGHQSTVVKSTEITAQVDGATPVLSGGLLRSQESASEVDEMMHFLPPRVFDAEGREGDMLNLVFVAQPADLQRAFTRAGWVKTDRWRPVFVWHLLQHGTNDARLPMSRFNLFGRVQDYSYALPDPEAIVSRRHHLRIWKTDFTMDGTPIWVGAATHDLAIEIATRGHLINHHIDPDVDAERNFIGAELAGVSSVSRRQYLLPEDPVFRAQTVSGEEYYSDSRILFLDLQQTSLSNTDVLKQSSVIVRASTGPIAVPAAPLQSHLASAH
jgi:LssY-like putative type I secretion system component LssY